MPLPKWLWAAWACLPQETWQVGNHTLSHDELGESWENREFQHVHQFCFQKIMLAADHVGIRFPKSLSSNHKNVSGLSSALVTQWKSDGLMSHSSRDQNPAGATFANFLLAPRTVLFYPAHPYAQYLSPNTPLYSEGNTPTFVLSFF